MDVNELPDNGVEDMIVLKNLSEQSLLMNLKRRYQKDLIYTYTGSILVSVNPFKLLPIYTQQVVNTYLGQRMGTLPPHIFATADSAFYHMQEDRKNQSLIISGESGAGKTEATKLILQYLAAMTQQHSEVEQMILESSPILESFGNARTVRNNNSSRFGKFMQVTFSSSGNITGARVFQYLLEKSRIVYQAKDERNYHIFYQLVAGSDDEEKKLYQIQDPKSYHYLNQSGIIQIPGGRVDDAEDFFRTKMALSFLKLEEEKQQQIFKVVGGILQLGNVEFKPAAHDGSEVKNPAATTVVAKLLEVDEDRLKESLTKRTMSVAGQSITMLLKPEQAEESRDALSKTLYARLFQWLVEMINVALGKCGNMESQSFIGILDIFGFENFKVNSFEQLCINFANEKLQQHFNHHIFKLEQEEYDKEKINWSKISFKDNQETIDLIEMLKPKPGIIALLDEQCRFPKATEKTFLDQLLSNFDGKHPNFDKNKKMPNQFIVKHYAGDVSYTITNFLDKNRDTLFADLLTTMMSSKSTLIRALFKDVQSDSDAGGKKQVRSVGGNFKTQLGDLTGILSSTFGHYVRCVKPNMALAADTFDDDMVLAQLRYAGMMETIKIRRNGYPIRYPHDEFWKRYRMLAPAANLTGTNYKKACDDLLPKVQTPDPDDWQNGLTKVFLRERMYSFLEDKRSYLLSFSAIKCQAFLRMTGVRFFYLEIKAACQILQREIRGYQARSNWEKVRTGGIFLQSVCRMLKARRKFKADLNKKREEERKKREEEERKKREEEERIKKQAAEFKKAHSDDNRTVEEIANEMLAKIEDEKADEEQKRKKIIEMKLINEQKEQAKEEAAAQAAAPAPKPPGGGRKGRLLDEIRVEKKKTGSLIKRQQDAFKVPAKDPPKYAKRIPRKPQPNIPDPPELAFEDLSFDKFPGFKKAEKKSKKSVGALFSKKKKAEEFGFSPDPLEAPLLVVKPELQATAVGISQTILTYQNKKSSNLEGSDVGNVVQIINTGVTHSDLRDEIYCQLVKQSIIVDKKKVKDADALSKNAWELIAACVVSFAPSPELLPYFLSFLNASSTNLFAKFCLKRLRRGLHFGGKYTASYNRGMPSIKEITAVIQQQPLIIKVQPLGEEKVVSVEIDNATTALEVIGIVAANPEFTFWDSTEFALYEDSGSLTQRILANDELIVDCLRKSERRGKSVDGVFTFKRKLYLAPYYLVPMQEDPNANAITVRQLMASITDGSLPCTDIETGLMLGALKYRLSENQKLDLNLLLPPGLLKLKQPADEETWKKTIKTKASQLTNTKTPNIHKQYIQTAKELPLYGFSLFKVNHGNPAWKIPANFELGIGRAGVQFLEPSDKSLICSFSYGEFGVDAVKDDTFVAVINLDGQDTMNVRLGCIAAADVASLVNDYAAVRKRECEYARALADYTPDNVALMQFSKDDMIYILDKDEEKGWYSGQCGSKSGSFPADLVQVKVDIPYDAGARFDKGRLSIKKRLDVLGLDCEGSEAAELTHKQKLQIKRNTIIKSNRGPGRSQRMFGGGGTGAGNVRKSLWRGTLTTPLPAAVLDADETPFIDFAEKYFRREPFSKDKEGRDEKEKKDKKKKTENFSPSVRTAWTKTPIKDSLLRIQDEKINKEAGKLFQDVMKYMGDYPTTSALNEVAQRLVQKALDYGEELQDEVYCQLMKQTTDNDKVESLYKGWELILLCVSVFLPSQRLNDYLFAHLWLGSKEPNASISLFANECIQRLERTQLKGARAAAPSLKEIDIITSGGGEFQVDVHLNHSEKKTIDIDSASTVKDVIDRLLRVCNLDASPEAWTLFDEVQSLKDGSKTDVGIPGTAKMGDVLAKWEKLGANYSTRLIFKKWVYLEEDKRELEDPTLLPYICYQNQLQVASGFFPVTEDEACQLAAYYLEIELGRYSEHTWKSKVIRPWHRDRDGKDPLPPKSPRGPPEASNLIPKSPRNPEPSLPPKSPRGAKGGEGPLILTSIVDVILPPSMKGNEKKISDSLKLVEKKYSSQADLTLKKQQLTSLHLSILKKHKFFGSTFFPVVYKEKKGSTTGVLALNGTGICLLGEDLIQPIKAWGFGVISSYSATSSSFTIISGNLSSPTRDVFSTKNAATIQSLFSRYDTKSKMGQKKAGSFVRRPF